MKRPDIVKPFKDLSTGINWEVVAYRELSTEEAVRAVRNYLATHKLKRKLVKGETYRIETLIGARDD